ncbi:hypothetical protein VTJ49DRAFT_1404 [Mycothermus thermophilus]|uniref:Uncharacterized protein n=1 Tax=Humicola insolens TaxID=85995 RepID=A0ABR3VCR6_HUMIN
MAPEGADVNGSAPAGSAAVAAPVKELDARPETSPYASPSCTLPFSNPLTVPLDVLRKCPKLLEAYETRLPELQALSEDVGHVLIHYLHTGTYGSLRPRPTDSMSKQTCELKTSIQVYAAARMYELPGLMRLAEAKIDKYGRGLSLPALLEVARDAYPNLTDDDDWFLDYLRSRIRPHLKDPKSLLSSNLLGQISNILSPNPILLRTLLELFCERSAVRPERAPSPALSSIASPITSPATSRGVSPLPATLEARSRSILREESTTYSEPANLPEVTTPPQIEIKPVPLPVPAPVLAPMPFADLGPVIVDVVPPPGLPIQADIEAQPVVESAPELEANPAVEPEVKAAAEAETKTAVEPSAENVPETEASTTVEPAVAAGVKPEDKTEVEPEIKPETDVPAVPEVTAAAELEPEPIQPAETVKDTLPVVQRERKDSGKDIDLGPISRDDSALELVPELETGSNLQPPLRPPLLREADSGFWEGTDVEPAKEVQAAKDKEPVAPVVELPAVALRSEPAHELESTADPKNELGVDTRDFATSELPAQSAGTEEPAEAKDEVSKEKAPVQEEAPESVPATESSAKDKIDTTPESEPAKEVDSAATLVVPETIPQTALVEEVPAEAKNKEVEAQPETEKVPKETVEPQAVEGSEHELKHELKATTSEPVNVPDNAQPAGSSETTTTEPTVQPGPEPAGESATLHRANTDSAIHAVPVAEETANQSPAVLSAQPAPEQQPGAKAQVEHPTPAQQLCSAHVRQRSWKKRFLSLKYPVFFGRGM